MMDNPFLKANSFATPSNSSENPFLSLSTSMGISSSELNTIPTPSFTLQPAPSVPQVDMSWRRTEVASPSIPTGDLIAQVESREDVVDVKKHLQRLEDLRTRLDNHLEQRNRETAVTKSNLFREDLSRRFEGGLQYYDEFQVLSFAQEKFMEYYPVEEFGFREVKEYRAIEKDNIDLLKKYQDLIKGATVKISFESAEFDEVMKVLIKVLPPDMLLRVADELEKHAPQLAGRKTIEL